MGFDIFLMGVSILNILISFLSILSFSHIKWMDINTPLKFLLNSNDLL